VQPDQVWPPYREDARRLAFEMKEYAPSDPRIDRREKCDGQIGEQHGLNWDSELRVLGRVTQPN
jgi:hypothetical protein